MAWENNFANTGLYADPANGGIGFEDWTSSEGGTGSDNLDAGFFSYYPYSTDTNVVLPGLSSLNTYCFGIYGKKDTNPSLYREARCFRNLKSPLMVGGDLVVTIGLNYRNGFKGVSFKNTSDTGNEIKFRLQGASNDLQYYTPSDGTVNWNSVFPYSINGQSFQIRFRRLTADDVSIRVALIGSSSHQDINIDTAGDGNLAVNQLEFFCGDTDRSPNEQNNLYFNFLSSYNAWRS